MVANCISAGDGGERQAADKSACGRRSPKKSRQGPWMVLPSAARLTPRRQEAAEKISPQGPGWSCGRKESGGDRIRTCDLEVMSLASYRAAPPRDVCCCGRKTGFLIDRTGCRESSIAVNQTIRRFPYSDIRKHNLSRCRRKVLWRFCRFLGLLEGWGGCDGQPLCPLEYCRDESAVPPATAANEGSTPAANQRPGTGGRPALAAVGG